MERVTDYSITAEDVAGHLRNALQLIAAAAWMGSRSSDADWYDTWNVDLEAIRTRIEQALTLVERQP